MAITKDEGRQWPLVATVTFAGTDVAAQGTYEAVDLPIGAIVTGATLYCIAADGGSGTIAVQVGTTVLIAAADLATNATALSTATAATTTVADTVDVVVATADLTEGSYRLTVEYVMDGRATETLD